MSARCLVLTLYCGENEFERSKASVTAQHHAEREHVVFERLPNKQAHERLYGEIMRRAAEFDLFVKFDADMVFVDDDALGRIVAFFAERPRLDHAMFSLADFLSDGPLMGMHVFSSRARWVGDAERLFVDPDPRIPGERLVVRGAPGPVALHAPDPSPYQAFHFGVHRALKAFQFGRKHFQHDQARKQWALLTRVWDHFERRRDPRVGLAVLGADLVWRREIEEAGERFDDPRVRTPFERHGGWPAEELHAFLAPRWRPGPVRAGRWAWSVGGRFARGLVASRLGRGADGISL